VTGSTSTSTRPAPSVTATGAAATPGSTNNPVSAWQQIPGQQPAWITGNYPGATWNTYAGPNNEFLVPYGNLQPGPGEDVYSGANMNVINQQWDKYYAPLDGQAMADTIVWGKNNPDHLVPAAWLANNPAPQYTIANPTDPSQPTQPNYVSPQDFIRLTQQPANPANATGPTTAQSGALAAPSSLTTNSSPITRPGSTNNPVSAWEQTPGQQPTWITGNYPGATWNTYAGPNNEFLVPYGNLQPGPGEDLYSSANMNVINQHWDKYYAQIDGQAMADTIVWGKNNPNHLVPAPWLANNPAPQYTIPNPADPTQPTQPNYVSPLDFYQETQQAGAANGTGFTGQA
jgi:hypothetical protein